MEDIFKSFLGKEFSERQELFMSKALTVFWGTICTIFAFYVGDISDSIIVSMNKIGSLANGPILGVFFCGGPIETLKDSKTSEKLSLELFFCVEFIFHT